MRGNEILLSAHPQGKFIEGIVSGTPLPGTVMEMVPNTAMKGGRFTWRASTQADGSPRLMAVLLADQLQGKTATDAYVTGTRCFMYVPIAGEEMNLIVDVPGTGTSPGVNYEFIGEKLMVRNNGHLTPWDSTKPCMGWQACENLPDLTAAQQLTWCIRTE